jgi:hypothetical protein
MALTIKVETQPGDDLRTSMTEMLDLARRLGVRVEMKANGSTFWVYPEDTTLSVIDAFDRLYLKSRLVAAHITKPVPLVP